MKYFDSLPKKDFESSIGLFLISDFFTYLDTSTLSLQTVDVLVDKKTTLLETSHLTYTDPNSFWSFLNANNTINPFTLLTQNTELFEIEYQNKINLQLSGDVSGTTGFVFPEGSIIVPFIANTGGSYSYSSVGNFDLNGPLSIVESASFYDGNMIIKDQTGATYPFIEVNGNTAAVVILSPVPGGTYIVQKPFYTTNPKQASKTVVITKKPSEGKEEFSEEKTLYDKGGKAPTALVDGTEITLATAIESENKNIKAYQPNELGVLISYFVTTKYN